MEQEIYITLRFNLATGKVGLNEIVYKKHPPRTFSGGRTEYENRYSSVIIVAISAIIMISTACSVLTERNKRTDISKERKSERKYCAVLKPKRRGNSEYSHVGYYRSAKQDVYREGKWPG